MLEHERSHRVRMTLGADRKLACRRSNLVTGLRSVRVVAVAALHQSRIYPMAEGPRELSFLGSVAPKAQIRLRLDEHEVHVARLMRAMTGSTAEAIGEVFRHPATFWER